MAEKRNQVAPASETDAIRGAIERTRAELGDTLDEIQDRLQPEHLLQQARDGVRDAAAGKVRNIMNSAGDTAGVVATQARDTGNYLARYAQEHPIRIAVTFGALAWWMLRGRDRLGYDGINDTTWDDEDVVYGSDRRSLRDRVGDYASSARNYASAARDTVGEYAAGAKETVGSYAVGAKEVVGDYAGSARTSAVRASERVRTAANSAYSTTGDWVSDNPMAAGVIALAVGAAIGMSIPRTDAEDRAMGETRDQAWRRASEAARNLKENVTQKVTAAADDFAADSLFGAAAPRNEPLGRA